MARIRLYLWISAIHWEKWIKIFILGTNFVPVRNFFWLSLLSITLIYFLCILSIIQHQSLGDINIKHITIYYIAPELNAWVNLEKTLQKKNYNAFRFFHDNLFFLQIRNLLNNYGRHTLLLTSGSHFRKMLYS